MQEAGQANQIRLGATDQIENARAELICVGALFPRHDGGGEIGFASALDAKGIRPTGDDLHDLSVENAVVDLVDEILQRRPAAADQHREANGRHDESSHEKERRHKDGLESLCLRGYINLQVQPAVRNCESLRRKGGWWNLAFSAPQSMASVPPTAS